MKIGYGTSLGECICQDSLTGLSEMKDLSIDLIITSPPFALQRKKAYGNESQNEYVDWFIKFADIAYQKLKESGSFVIDIGSAYNKGVPAYSLYQFRLLIKLCDELGYQLAQPFYWHNSSALPSPIEWVNKRKLRAKNSVNTIWWLCKNPNFCKANISNVLNPYSDRMKQQLNNHEEFIKGDFINRPSGHNLKKASWVKDNGGSIPSNLLVFPNTESNSNYLKWCKLIGIKGHPARFPSSIPNFFIKFLTDAGDFVVDIFGGSNTTGMVAEKMGRRWKTFELEKEYVANSVFRFINGKDISEFRTAYENILNGRFLSV